MNDHPAEPSWMTSLKLVSEARLRRALWRIFERAEERISAHAGDKRMLIVLVSRRMTCLYHMLKASGFNGFDGAEVVSNRALDSRSVDLAGRSIVLLDDAFILGSTLADLYDFLVEREDPPHVAAMVACIDEERFSRALLDHVGITLSKDGPERCTTKELEQFGLELASCLYRAGVPYFSDFPVVRELRISPPALDALRANDRWYVADVTPLADFAGPGRRAYSLIPRDSVATAIRSRLAGTTGSIAELLKARLYVSESDEALTLRIVPIGVPGAVTRRRLERELEAVDAAIQAEEPALDWRSWTLPAKHRLLQMYVSTCVLAELWGDLEPLLDLMLDRRVLEPTHVQMYFGERDVGRVLSAFDGAVAAYAEAKGERDWPGLDPALTPRSGLGERREVRCDLASNGVFLDTAAELGNALRVLRNAVRPEPPQPGHVSVVDRLWAHEALEVFGLVDRALERPQEQQLRKYSYEEYRKYKDADGDDVVGPRVIKQGIAVGDMSRLLMPELRPDNEWSRVLCSLAIDIGNDLGVVVPSTRAFGDDSPVFRQYRSGETAYLVNQPHAALYRADREEAIRALDWYTRAVIKQDLGGDDHAFLDDVDRVGDASLGGGTLVQIWDGTVTDVTTSHFELDVHSRLADDAGSARLELDVLGAADRRAVAPGARVEWIIVQRNDELGRGHRGATVRVLQSLL
jgi:hypothetical protein